MKLNRKWLLLVALVLSLAMATTGTLAYLTDQDADVNVMTLGKVEIVQNEQERDEDGNLQPFTPNKPALPAVGPTGWADEGVEVNGIEYKVFTEDLKNVIDKIVTVTNTGKSDAYVRTIVAIEAPESDPHNLIHINWNGTDCSISEPIEAEIDGVDYVAFVFTYKKALAAGETSAPSLVQLFLDKATTNEDVEKFGDTWEVLVLSQAIQADGFPDAATALNEGFGEVDVEELFGDWAEWDEDDIGSPGDKWPNNNPPVIATVERHDPKTVDTSNMIMLNVTAIDHSIPIPEVLDCCYTFTATDTETEAGQGPYAEWYADYIVSFDQTVLAGEAGLAGAYGSYKDGQWLGIVLKDMDLEANQEVRLLSSTIGAWKYPDICGTVQSFSCGAFDYGSNLSGATLTVKLCLIDPDNADNVIVVQETKHTFE